MNAAQKKFDVTVIGNAGLDTNIYLAGREIDFSVESNFTENIDYAGQAGGYSARGFAQLGFKTAFIGYLGDDFQGRYLLEELAGDGINTDAVFIDPAGTSRSVNFMYPDGRRKNFYDGKSHMALEPDLARCSEILQASRLAHFHIPNWARKLLPLARRKGLTIACDIQDVTSPEDPYRKEFIDHADILFFSAVNHESPLELIGYFLHRHPRQIVIAGMGARGCVVGTREEIQQFEAVTLPEPVIDTNGAGDALAAGFLSSFVLGDYSLEDSLHRGQIAARYTCTLKAGSSNLITMDKMNKLFLSVPVSLKNQ